MKIFGHEIERRINFPLELLPLSFVFFFLYGLDLQVLGTKVIRVRFAKSTHLSTILAPLPDWLNDYECAAKDGRSWTMGRKSATTWQLLSRGSKEKAPFFYLSSSLSLELQMN